MWEDEWIAIVTITIYHSKHNDVDWVFAFHQYRYSLVGTEQINGYYARFQDMLNPVEKRGSTVFLPVLPQQW